ERSPAGRLELYNRVEARALDLMPVVPLVWFRSHLAAQPFVRGFVVDPLARFDAAAIRLAR
ncbi:MAG TPA: ABC transporter substrate-binding protein, partial [Actinomycetota bacterium]|nr:ABC transporter substrate-binding protein [Actinomycetota bacterium]